MRIPEHTLLAKYVYTLQQDEVYLGTTHSCDYYLVDAPWGISIRRVYAHVKNLTALGMDLRALIDPNYEFIQESHAVAIILAVHHRKIPPHRFVDMVRPDHQVKLAAVLAGIPLASVGGDHVE